jgi:hypothetical protein
MLNAFFLRTQGVIEIPGTYFLYFNTPIINSIRQKYHVGSKIVTNSQLNKRIKEQLATIGFVENIYPQKGMDQFDTLILLIALGISEGLSCNYCMRVPGSPSLDSDRYEIFHVSGTTIRSTAHLQTPSFERWRLRGSFFWYRLLEAHNDDELKRQYQKKYGDIKAGELLDKVPGSREKLGNEFFTTVDRILRQYYKIQK